MRSSDRYFTVLAISNATPTPRLGLAISKKSIRKATKRNWIKRHIRESFRQSVAQLPGLDLVVLSKSGVDQLAGPLIQKSLAQHWMKLKRLCEKSSC